MNSIKIDTLEQYYSYQSKGYTSTKKDICILLGIKESTLKLKDVPKIKLSEYLYNQLLKNQKAQSYISTDSRIHKDYYNDKEVVKSLLNEDAIFIMYSDGNNEYEELCHNFIIDNIDEFISLLGISESAKVMELRDKYDFRWDRLQNDTLYYLDDGVYRDKDIYKNANRNTYIRELKEKVHLKFSVGGNDLYCDMRDIISDIIKKYKAEGK